ncbi:MAG TPA: hypothetical protein VMQ65_02690 [Candidatus Limnocylindria bacterium]|nr:hypothetical protein [Candidatus Limnocylindria bacterium]
MHDARLGLAMIALAAALAGCADEGSSPIDLDPRLHHSPGHAGGPGGGGDDIALVVGFRDEGTDRVTSDGAGDYVHGVDRVEAMVAEFGQFVFDSDTDRGRAPALIRTVCVDFGDRADADDPGPEDDPPFHEECVEAKWNVTDVPGGMQNLAPGETVTGQSRLLWVADDLNYKVLWGDREIDHPDDPNQVFVTRVDADTWIVESMSEQVAVLMTLATKGDAEDVKIGEWHMPFRLVLRRK